MLTEEIFQKIINACSLDNSIIAAYIFGSEVKEINRVTRDIDIALFLDPKKSDLFDLLSFTANMEKSIDRPVDVVVLNRAGEVLKFQIRKFGRLIFERNTKKRTQFEVTSRKYYEDFLYLHRRYTDKNLYGESTIND